MKRFVCAIFALCLCALLTLPLFADNFGEEDDFDQNIGQEDDFDTQASTTVTEQDTTAQGTDTTATLETSAPLPSDTAEQSVTTKKPQTVFPPDKEQVWALPIPVIWGAIALIGVGGIALAVVLFLKYFKNEK